LQAAPFVYSYSFAFFLMTNQTTEAISLSFNQEQALSIHAALLAANTLCRDKELQFMNMHESKTVGSVTRAEALKAFKLWEQYESETAQALNVLSKAYKASWGDIPFSGFVRFR